MAEKNYLIAVDLQKDFVDGALGSKEAEEMLSSAEKHIRERRKQGWRVIATLDTHDNDYMSTREGRYLPVPHCIRGTEGWKIHPDLRDALDGCETVEKPTFGSVKLPDIIKKECIPGDKIHIELIGLCTDICVVSNAMLLKAAFPEADIAVKKDCCAGVTPAKHEAALETMASCQIDII